MDVESLVATLLRRICTLESQMNEIRSFLPKYVGFHASNEDVSNSAFNNFLNEKNENLTTQALHPRESVIDGSNAVVERVARDDSLRLKNGGDTSSHSQLVGNDGFCSDMTTTEVAALSTLDDVSNSRNVDCENPDGHLNSEQHQPEHHHAEELNNNVNNPFYLSLSSCGVDGKVQDRICFPKWKDAWVKVPPLDNSITSDENPNHIRLSDSIDMLSAMGGRDDFGLELGRRRPSPMTPCFRQQQHASVQTQTNVISQSPNCNNLLHWPRNNPHNDVCLSYIGGCYRGISRCDTSNRSEGSIKVLKTPASVIRHGLVGRCDRLMSDSSNRDQRKLMYKNNYPVYYNDGGDSISHNHERERGEKMQQHTTTTAVATAYHSCCMADTFANAEAQRVEHQHVHWPDEYGERLVKDHRGNHTNTMILGGGEEVNFSLPETPGLSPVYGVVGNKDGDINFSPSNTPFTPIIPAESSEIRSFTSADTEGDGGGMTASISPGFEYTEKLDPAKSLFISSPTPEAAPEAGSSTGALSSPSCSIFETMSVSTNMSLLPPLSQSHLPNQVTGVVDGGGGNVHVNCINHNDKEFALPLFVDKEKQVQPTTVAGGCSGIESTTINVKHLSNQQNVKRWHHFMPTTQSELVRSQSWGDRPRISSVHDERLMKGTPSSTNNGEYQRSRSFDGEKPSFSKMSSEFWRRRLASHGVVV